MHVISFDVPWPADYGGIIDVFYKVKALHDLGIGVHLHCFQYGRDEAARLQEICKTVTYYPRKTGWQGFSAGLPYIVSSRSDKLLIKNLLKDDLPILFEGIHSCFYLGHKDLQERWKAVRLHNIEWQYYRALGEHTTSFLKQIYFNWEAWQLKHFEKQLIHANLLLPISLKDTEYYKRNSLNARYLPAFHPVEHVTIKEGKGNYALYHGNLSVPENEAAALFLLNEVFRDFDYPFIIAGKNPGKSLQDATKDYDHITLISNPGEEEMRDWIQNAHIHVLPTQQSTGIKLKLLQALFTGRFVLVNSAMINGTELKEQCVIVDTTEAMQQKIRDIMDQPFTAAHINSRSVQLQPFNNEQNAQQLITLMGGKP